MSTIAPSPFHERIEELQHYVGNTPLFHLKNLSPNPNVEIWAKLEWQQFGGSVKARAAYRIIREAVRSGQLREGKILLDATSGNTGIAYAIFAAVAGIPLTLCVPENASKERKNVLKSLGVNVIYTSAIETTDGAQRVAKQLAETAPDKYFYADQYANPNNWKAHYKSTAPEIFAQTEGHITHFVAGLGTTGTFTGTGRRLQELNPDIQRIALQPETALHGLEGWKHLETAHTPAIYDASVADALRTVDTGSAYTFMRRAAKEEGLLLSPSSAANLAGAVQLASELDSGVIVTVFADDAAKYSEVVEHVFQN